MAIGLVSYELLAASTNAASSDAAHYLFDGYTGLSLLNNNDVVEVRLTLDSANSPVKLTPSLAASPTIQYHIHAANQPICLPPMRAGTASQMHIFNHDAGQNAEIEWSIWRRVT